MLSNAYNKLATLVVGCQQQFVAGFPQSVQFPAHPTAARATLLLTVIEVDHIRKTYGDIVAVNDISFTAQPGEIFGLLGPNGAGKTTTIGCISGLLTPTAGHVRIMGHDVVREGAAARRLLGVVPQEISLYDDLSASRT
jgi:ABC-type sugar transport system ATPase subunit